MIRYKVYSEQHPRVGLNIQHVIYEQLARAGQNTCPVYKGMLKPIIISYKLTTCQLLYLTNTYKPREILFTILPFSVWGLSPRKATHSNTHLTFTSCMQNDIKIVLFCLSHCHKKSICILHSKTMTVVSKNFGKFCCTWFSVKESEPLEKQVPVKH